MCVKSSVVRKSVPGSGQCGDEVCDYAWACAFVCVSSRLLPVKRVPEAGQCGGKCVCAWECVCCDTVYEINDANGVCYIDAGTTRRCRRSQTSLNLCTVTTPTQSMPGTWRSVPWRSGCVCVCVPCV